jgi:peptidoglycan/LPS O-acetylase OafA/YrhL
MTRSLSLYLDVLRPLAALFVLLSHISQPHISGQLKALSNAGSQAVVVFFVLSGFVIAHVCATKETTLRVYAIARAGRIYSVALPALFLTLCLDILGQEIQPAAYPQAYQPFTPFLVVRSISFLGEQWGAHRYPGSNSAYWSLGFEVWYYVAFGAFLFYGSLAAVVVLLFIGPKVAVMFPLWLLGVAVYRVCDRWKMTSPLSWVCLLSPLCLVATYEVIRPLYVQPFMPPTVDRVPSLVQDYFIACMFSIHLIGFASLSSTFAAALERYSRPIRWIAGATFSVYLTHLPIMCFLVALGLGALPVAVLIALTLLICFVFAEFTERKKHFWTSNIERMMPERFLL